MTMQITAPQAQKRCCFIEISSCSETNASRCVLKYYSRWDALVYHRIGQVLCRFRHFSIHGRRHAILPPEGGGELTGTAVSH